VAAGAQEPECTRAVHEDFEHRRTPPGARAVVLRSISGFTLLELVLVIILVIVLFSIAFDRLMPMRGDAEAAHVTGVVGGLRSALALTSAEKVTLQGLEALDELVGINPMTMLAEQPDNYLGEDARPEPGSWYFAAEAEELRYRVRYPEYLAGAPEPPVELAWRIELLGDGERRRGVHLVALEPWSWPGHSRALRELSGAESRP